MRIVPRLLTTALISVLASNARAQTPPSSPAPAAPAATPAAPAVSDANKEEARSHFELGLSHFDREEWDAALAEFRVSRKLFPTRSATKDAALCLRRLHVFDEALDMWDALEREFGATLSATDRALADKEMAELRASVGFIDVRGAEPGATIQIDGTEKGTFPPSGPFRVSAGRHVVIVSKQNFLPFEGKPDVAGKQTVLVDAKLGALTAGGQLHVTEQSGRALDVVVDGAVVGKTPWDGRLGVASHNVVLRGDGNLGTQPVEATVRLNQLTTLTLAAEPLEAGARVAPTPAGASVAIDGVVVGHGVWEGKLRAGGHRIEVASEGFLPFSRSLSLSKGEHEVVGATLERDPSSPMWASANPPRFFIEVDGALMIAPSLGGDVTSTCSGSCTSGLAIGGSGVFHGGYQLGNGLGFAIDAGYLGLGQTLHGRKTSVTPQGLPADQGTASDTLSLAGLLLGASASFHRGATWPVLLRLGVGVLLGSASDARTGTFTAAGNPSATPVVAGGPFKVNQTESASAPYLAFAPEVRLGRRFGTHFEVNVGVTVLIMTGLSKATWQDGGNVPAGADGVGTFVPQGTSEAIVGSTVFAVLPGLGARYEF